MVLMSPTGGPSRCYNFFMDFLKCIEDNGDNPPACKAWADDYLECLHHRRYTERKLEVEQERRRQEAAAAGGGHGHGH